MNIKTIIVAKITNKHNKTIKFDKKEEITIIKNVIDVKIVQNILYTTTSYQSNFQLAIRMGFFFFN